MNIIKNKPNGLLLFIIFTLIITAFLLTSIFDTDKTVSEKENRTLATFPKFSFSSLFKGEFINDFETHYSDTFPLRDKFLELNEKINKIAQQFTTGKESDVVIIDGGDASKDFNGESLHDKESAS